MKNICQLIVIITITIAAGCSGETQISEPKVNTIENTAEKFATTKKELISWKDSIYQKLDQMETQENQALEQLARVKVATEDETQVNIAKAALTELITKRDNMKQLYAVVMDLFAVDENKFATFSADVERGNMDDDAIQKELIYYNVHLNSYQSDIKTWKSVLEELEINSSGNTKNILIIADKNSK